MQKHYGKGSADREGLNAAIEAFQKRAPLDIPLVLGGKSVGQE
jgi:1-pyrroline-5-carboxylate dehydrogenase